MAKLNPCCCMSLEIGVIVLVIVDIVLSSIIIGLFGVTLKRERNIGLNEPKLNIDMDYPTQIIISSLIHICIGIFKTLLSLYLWHSVRMKNAKGCTIWLIITAILFLIGLIFVITMSVIYAYFKDIIFGVFEMIYKLYEMLVVYCFIQELKTQGRVVPGAIKNSMEE